MASDNNLAEFNADVVDEFDILIRPLHSLTIQEDVIINENDENVDTSSLLLTGSFKRRADSITVEGTPCRLDKRIDDGKSPYPLQQVVPLNISNSIEEQLSRQQPKASSRTTLLNDKVRKVKVLVAGGDHDTGQHQENFKRIELLIGKEGCLRRTPVINCVEIIDEMRNKACIADLIRVHEMTYLEHLENKVSGTLGSSNQPIFYSPSGFLDADTPIGASSLDAAKFSCGAALQAVDIAFDKKSQCKRFLILGRPPGHHAGHNGCVVSDYYWQRPEMSSSGFCLLNTVAVAAGYARYKYGSRYDLSTVYNKPTFPKVAIIDFDIHHGNGTEDIIKNLRPRYIHLPLPSSWAPIQRRIYKPWLNENDANDVLFASVNLVADNRFYPCSGDDTTPENDNLNIINIGLTPIGPGPWDQRARQKLTQKDKSDYCARASAEFRSKVASKLLPRLTEFQPNIIFISAGFDAHVDDFYHFLSEDDFHWITNEIVAVADETDASVVSVLEGGYSLASVEPTHIKGSKGLKSSTGSTQNLFCQIPGDGGLVKGVLAHVAALAGKSSWL